MRDYVLLATVVFLIPFILQRAWIGVIAWLWVSFMSPHQYAWGVARSFPIAKLIAVVSILSLFMSKDKIPIPWNKSLITVAMMLVLFCATSTMAWYPDIAFSKLIEVFKIFLMVFISTKLIYGRNKVRWFILAVAFFIGFFGIKGGIFSLLTGGNFRIWGPPRSFLADNNAMGLALVMVLPLFIFLAR